MNQPGKVIIITAPSGSGKTSITRYLLQQFPQLAFSISATTRKPRGEEVHGREYYFLSEEDFKQKIKEEAFVEWEMVYEGKYYGTLKSEITRMWNEGKVPVLDIDVQGALHIRQQLPGLVLSIFIEAPSIEELRKRLESRGTETEETINVRLSKAAYEMSFKHQFDAIVVNDNLERAQKDTASIIEAFLAK
jgi:guanylate kinase